MVNAPDRHDGLGSGDDPARDWSDPDLYGEAIADSYDESTAEAPTEMIDFLAARSGCGRVLELGVGTGRVAIALAARGIEVHGVDSSAKMLARLAAKPGGRRVRTHLGDMASLAVPGPFQLVYSVASSLYGVASAQAQIACVAAVASVLAPGGVFVSEGYVPDVVRYRARGQGLWVSEVTPDGVVLVAAKHDPVHQTITSQQIVLTGNGVRLLPSRVRYLWPSELDLICRLAGLSVVNRLGGWRGEPFAADSSNYVGVYAAST